MKHEEQPFKFGIRRIQDLAFSIDESVDIFDYESVQVAYALDLSDSEENEWIEFKLKVKFTEKGHQRAFLTGTIATTFYVKDIKKYIDYSTNTFKFPPKGLLTMFRTSFTHARAILAKNTAGTKFKNIFIPIVDPQTLLVDLLKTNTKKVLTKETVTY